MASRSREHELETESERELRNVLPASWVMRDLTKGDCRNRRRGRGLRERRDDWADVQGAAEGDRLNPANFAVFPLDKFQLLGLADVQVLL